MKPFISFLLMGLLSFTACLFFPWWSIAIVCFLVTLALGVRPGIAFISGFLSLFLLWAGMSFWISYNNEHILAHKVSLLILKQDNPNMLILVTGLIGALVGGFSALSGALLRKRGK